MRGAFVVACKDFLSMTLPSSVAITSPRADCSKAFCILDIFSEVLVADFEVGLKSSFSRGWFATVMIAHIMCNTKAKFSHNLSATVSSCYICMRFQVNHQILSGQFNAPAALFPVPFGCESEWVSEPV